MEKIYLVNLDNPSTDEYCWDKCGKISFTGGIVYNDYRCGVCTHNECPYEIDKLDLGIENLEPMGERHLYARKLKEVK